MLTETPKKLLILKEETKQWRFGMVGHGIDLPHVVLPNMPRAFSSQLRVLSESPPGMPEAQVELGPAQKVQHQVLDQHPVDMLLVDGITEEAWSPWMTKCEAAHHRPQEAVSWSGPLCFVVDETAGPIHKSF
jgi:hypothetical protein